MDWRRIRAALAAALVSVGAFAGTARVMDPGLYPARGTESLLVEDEAAVVASVADFQRIYQDFFASGGVPALLDEFPASREVKHQLFRDIGFVRDAGLVLVQDLASATVIRASRSGRDTAELVVYEEWNHVFQRSDDRKPVSQLRGIGAGFKYRLRKMGDRWIVVGWDPEAIVKPPEDRGRKW